MKTRPTAYKSLPTEVQKFDKYYINHTKVAQKALKFCQSGEISANMVTLLPTYLPIES